MLRQFCIVMCVIHALSACATLTGGGGSSAQLDGPPLVNGYYVGAGDRCGEACATFGKWRATARVDVYAEALDDAKAITHIASGDWVTTLPGQTLNRPLRGTVQKPGGGLNAGEVVFHLFGEGEGFSYVVWRKGQLLGVEAEGANAPSIMWDERPATLPASVWWVRVELQNGKTGWLRNPSNFEGMGPLS